MREPDTQAECYPAFYMANYWRCQLHDNEAVFVITFIVIYRNI